MSKLQGIVPPVVTPLRDGKVDHAGLEKLLNHMIAGGVHGLFILGTTGEGPALGMERQKQVIDRTMAIVGNRLPVLAGVSAAALDDSLRLAEYATERGVSYLVCAPPCYFLPGNAEVIDYYEALAANISLPLYVYNIPSMTKTPLSPAIVQKLSQIPGVAGYKDSSGNMCDLHEVLIRLGGRDDFSVFVGPEELLGEAVLFGADGGVSGGANLNPRLFVEMYHAARTADLERMRRLQRAIYQQRRLYSIGHYQSSIIKGIKSALSFLDICGDEMAAPFAAFDRPERDAVGEILRQLEL